MGDLNSDLFLKKKQIEVFLRVLYSIEVQHCWY